MSKTQNEEVNMKCRRIIKILSGLFLLIFTTLFSSVCADKLVPGKDYIWLEAEKGQSNIDLINNPAASGGRYLHLFGKDHLYLWSKFFYVTMSFKVKKEGFYRIYVSASSPHSVWRSPYEVCLDGEVIKASQIATTISNTYMDKIGWVDVGKIKLLPGKHKLKVRSNKRATRYDRYCMDVDAAVLVPISNKWKPSGINKPTFVAESRITQKWKPGMEDIKICSDVNNYEVTGTGGSNARTTISTHNPQPDGKPSLLVQVDFLRKAPIIIKVKKTAQIQSSGGRIILWINDNSEHALDYYYGKGFRIRTVFTDANGKEVEVFFAEPLNLHRASGEIIPGWIKLEVPICMADEEEKLHYPLDFKEMRIYPYFWTKGQHNEFFLGDLYVEMKGVHFRYFEYERAEISPDLISTPLFFGMDYNFSNNAVYPRNVELVLELPESVRIEKWETKKLWEDITDFCNMQIEPITREGKRFIRYAIDYPITANCIFTYSYPGKKRILYYLSTRIKEGTVNAYYYLRFPEYGYSEIPRKLPLDVIRIKEEEAPNRLMTQMHIDLGWPGMTVNLKRLAINRIHVGDDIDSNFTQTCNKSGVVMETDISSGGILHNLVVNGAPGAIDINENVSSKRPCLSRTKNAIQGIVEQNKYLIDRGFTFFAFDDESWGGIQCFCDTCLAGFEKFRKIYGKDLPDFDPKVFCVKYKEQNKGHLHNLRWWSDTGTDDSARKLYRLWQDYHHANYSKTAGRLKDGMQKYATRKGIKEKIEFYDEWLQSTCSKYTVKIAAQEAFDYIGYAYYGTNPKECGDIVQTAAEWIKNSGAKFYWLLGPGLSYCWMQNLHPHNIMKWNLLETFAVGVDGVNMYDYADIDLLDMKYYSDAIWTILPVEDIVVEGKRAEVDIRVTKGKSNLRALKKGNEYLILISEYNHKDNRQIKIKIPDTLKDQTVWNLNERKQIGKVSRQNSSFIAKLSAEERAVMYYVGERNIH